MGLRGPGAKPIRQFDRGPHGEKPTPQPWEAPKLGRLEQVELFLETLPVTSGKFAGTLFRLRPFQKEILKGIYQIVDGKRIVREAFISMPRKNGKTGLASGIALCHLCGPEAIKRGQVYVAASDREQAGLLYEEMKAIILAVPWMSDRVIIRDFRKEM